MRLGSKSLFWGEEAVTFEMVLTKMTGLGYSFFLFF